MNNVLGWLQIGSERARTHNLEEVKAELGIRYQTNEPQGMVWLTVDRPDKEVRMWLSPAGLFTLLRTLLGNLPMGTVDHPEIQAFGRMIRAPKEKVSYVVQRGSDLVEEEYRVWSPVWGMHAKEAMAWEAISNHERYKAPHEIFRVVEVRERPIPKP